MSEFYINVEVEPTTVLSLNQSLLLKLKPHHTIESLKCGIYNELLTIPHAASKIDNSKMLHLLRFNDGIITQDKAKVSDFGITDGSVVSVRYEPICPTVQRAYVYEIISGYDHIGLYTNLQKAKEAVKKMKNDSCLQINRIPLDTTSYFTEMFDCVWDNDTK